MIAPRPPSRTFARAAALALVALAAAACGRGPTTSSEYNNSGKDAAVALNPAAPAPDNHSVPWDVLARQAQQASASTHGNAAASAGSESGKG